MPTGPRKARPDDRLRVELCCTSENLEIPGLTLTYHPEMTKAGLLRRGACHRARIRATRWLLATMRKASRGARDASVLRNLTWHPHRSLGRGSLVGHVHDLHAAIDFGQGIGG